MTDHRDCPDSADEPDDHHPVPPSESAHSVAGWVAALLVGGVAVVLLGTIVDGYVLALHQQLVPADHFGFRDDTTRSCWPRWYAAQKAGFSWLLFGNGPVLLGSMAICVGAAKQRRPATDILLLVFGVVLSTLPFTIAAAVHANSVAQAITC